MDNRPLTGNANGQYNLNFVDWTNEWERIIDESMLQEYIEIDRQNNPEAYEDTLDEQYQDQGFYETTPDQKLKKEYIKRIKMMKIGKSSRKCAICIKPFAKNNVIFRLPCKHIFHRECLKPWFDKMSTCPCCRLDINEYFEKEDNEKIESEEENDYDELDFN